jgi:hypothetical protein
VLGQTSQAMLLYNMARTYCRAGKGKKGLELLLKAFNTGLYFSDKLEEDESFDCLRTDKRFLDLIEAVKLVNFTLQLEEKDPGNELLLGAMEKACELSPSYAYPSFILARLYARRNLNAKALAQLKESMERGFKNYCAIVGEPAFESIRSFKEFQKLFKG